MRLFEIASDYEQLLNQLFDPETGEISEQAMARLESVSNELDAKLIAVAGYIQNLDAEKQAIKNAKDAMAAREATYARKVNSMMDYLQMGMERTGKTEISCPHFAIKLKKCPVSVDISASDLIPDEYMVTKVVKSENKAKIKADILAGILVPGASLKQNLRLEIR